MKQRPSFLPAILIVLVLLAGCEKTIPLQGSFWQKKDAKIGVVVKHTEAYAYRDGGGEGLLDMAINEAMAAELKTHLRQIDLSGFDLVLDRFARKLREQGFTVKRFDEKINFDKFPKFEGSGDNRLDRDLRGLAEKDELDLLLLLSVERLGTIRPYWGFIPLGPPKALVQAKRRLVNLRTNELMWQTRIKEDDSRVAVEGDWDQPPRYPNLTRAVQKAIDQATQHLERAFFATSQ